MSENVNFIQGRKEQYNPSEMQGGLFFSKDSKEILLNGESYGNATPADEEDITAEDGNLKLKDRAYDEANFSGKGYKILRKNIQDGKNILTQDMINEPNTIYEIRYDFDLNGVTISIPEGCSLDFRGGSISNGLLEGSLPGIIDLNYIRYDDLSDFFDHITLIDGNTVILERNKVYTISSAIHIAGPLRNISIKGSNAVLNNISTSENLTSIIAFFGKTKYSNVVNITSSSSFGSKIDLQPDQYNIEIGDIVILRNDTVDEYGYYYESSYSRVTDVTDSSIYIEDDLQFSTITNLKVVSPSYNISIENLTLNVNATNVNGISLNNSIGGNIEDVTVNGSGCVYGIYVTGINNYIHTCKVKECLDIDRVVNMGGYGIYAGGNNCVVYQNEVSDCRHCISSASRTYITKKLCITHNVVQRTNKNLDNLGTTGQPAVISSNIDAHGLCQDTIIRDNTIYSKETSGISLRGKSGVIENNTVIVDSQEYIPAIGLSERACNCTINNNKLINYNGACLIQVSSISDQKVDINIINNICSRLFIRLSSVTGGKISISFNTFDKIVAYLLDAEVDNEDLDVYVNNNILTYNSTVNSANSILNSREELNKINNLFFEQNVIKYSDNTKILLYDGNVVNNPIFITNNKFEKDVEFPTVQFYYSIANVMNNNTFSTGWALIE